MVRSDPLKTPPPHATKAWDSVDDALNILLLQHFPSFNSLGPDEMLEALVKTIKFYFPNHRSDDAPENEPHVQSNNRSCHHSELKTLRKRKRSLRAQWRARSSEPLADTASLRAEFHSVHKRIKRLTAHRSATEDARKRSANTTKFRANPFKFGKRLYHPQTSTPPTFSSDEALRHFVKTYSDTDRPSGYHPFSDAPPVPQPSVAFDLARPSFSDFLSVIRKSRNSSAPGPNGIPYIVWKRCPSLQRRLYTIFCRVWHLGTVPTSWQQAVIVLIHKSGAASDPTNFRPIALSNCDGKLFFSLVSRKICTYMKVNSYWSGLDQKGFLPGISGCVEHASLTAEALRNAQSTKSSLCIAWVDLRNAFGSVRHMLIQHCLSRYHFPPSLCNLVFHYYEQLVAKVELTQDNTAELTPAFHYATGVFQGCTLSPALFNICFQPLLDTLLAASIKNGWSYTFKNVGQTPIKRDVAAYADDLELCTWNTVCCQALLNLTDKYLEWSRSLAAKAVKCYAAAMRQNEYHELVRFDPRLTISTQQIQYLSPDIDFKYLGRFVNTRSSEINSRQCLSELLSSLLDITDKQLLPGPAKLWLYNHFVITKISWPLLILDLSLSFVKKLHAQALVYLKRWSGLPRCANTAILFSGGDKRPGLRLRNICTYWKQQQNIKLSLLHNSDDARCRSLYDTICQRQGKWTRKFAPAIEAQCAEASVASQLSPSAWASFVKNPLGKPPSLPPKALRTKTNNQLHEIDVAAQLSKLSTLQTQGRWLEWTTEMHLDLSWNRLIHHWSDSELRFALQGLTDTAPTNTNLRRWGNPNVDPSCSLCGRPATLRHVLNACATSLFQGRFTWRHDSVLAVLKRHLLQFWTSQATKKAAEQVALSSSSPYITFRTAGGLAPPQRSARRLLKTQALLLHALDWEFLFDLGSSLVFPPEIALTSQRPDIVIFSRTLKTVILIELTVPLEDRTSLAHDRKMSRYASLCTLCTENGWRCSLYAVEVGCLGFVSLSLLQCFENLGFSRSLARRVRNECSRVALRCSYLLFLRRQIPAWSTLDPL